jgi:hypothetical protein
MTAGGSGTVNGTVNYSVAADVTGSNRTGDVDRRRRNNHDWSERVLVCRFTDERESLERRHRRDYRDRNCGLSVDCDEQRDDVADDHERRCQHRSRNRDGFP